MEWHSLRRSDRLEGDASADPPKRKMPRMERAAKARAAASQDQARQEEIKSKVNIARETARSKGRSNHSDASDDIGGAERVPPQHLQAVLFWNQNKDLDDVAAQQSVPTEMLEMAFQEIDEDSSGFIVVEELVEALHMCGLKAHPKAVERIILDMDKNNDGDIDIVEFCEFFRQLEELSQFHHKAKARAQFCSILCNCCFFLNLALVFVLIPRPLAPTVDPDLYQIVRTCLIAMIIGLGVLFMCVIGLPATKLSIGKHVEGWVHYYDQIQIAKTTLKPVQAAAPGETAEATDDPEKLRAAAWTAVQKRQLALPGVPPTVSAGMLQEQDCEPPGVIADASGNFIRYDPAAYSRAAFKAIEARQPKNFNPMHTSNVTELPGDPSMSRAPKALTSGSAWKSSPWAEPIEDQPRGPQNTGRFGHAALGNSARPELGNASGGTSQGMAALPAPEQVLEQVDLDADWESRYKYSKQTSEGGARDSYQTEGSEVFQRPHGAPRGRARPRGRAAELAAALLLALGSPAGATSMREASRGAGASPGALLQERLESLQRRECLAREEMATRIYPIEKHPVESYVVRRSLPATSVGDVHLKVGDVQLTRVVATVTLARKSDSVFSFGLHGDGGAAMAMVEGFLDKVDFVLPESAYEGLAKGFSSVENWFGTLGGLVDGDYGQIEKLKVSANISMSGDVRTDERGKWELEPDTQTSKAKFDIGSGGLVLSIINSIMAGSGGKAAEEAIFDLLWPQVLELLPAWAGVALGTVPKSEGNVEHKIEFDAWCESPKGRLCPAHLMQLKGTMKSTAHVLAKPVLQKLAEQGDAGVLSAVADAYRESDAVVGGLKGEFTVDLGLSKEHALSLRARPNLDVPLRLLQALGPDVRPEDFLPGSGRLSLQAGRLDVRDGVIQLPQIRVDNAHLPIGAGKDTIEIRGALEEFTVELVDPTGCKPKPSGENASEVFDQLCGLVGEGAPLTVSAPGVTLGMDRVSGVQLEPWGGGDTFTATYASKGVSEFLEEVDDRLAMPSNVRTAPPDSGDGVVPPQFQRPHDRALPTWDVGSLLRHVNVSFGGSVTTVTTEGSELVEVTVSADVAGSFFLGPSVLRAALDGADNDLGYMHLVAGGWYGTGPGRGGSGSSPDQAALVRLSCGGLELYKVSPGGRPYAALPHITLDLAKDEDWQMLGAGEPEEFQQMLCFKVKATDGFLFFSSGAEHFFCPASRPLGRSLEAALKLQRGRLEAARAQTASCEGDRGACPARPDGTWFKPSEVYDRTTWQPQFKAPGDPAMERSPNEQWLHAASALGLACARLFSGLEVWAAREGQPTPAPPAVAVDEAPCLGSSRGHRSPMNPLLNGESEISSLWGKLSRCLALARKPAPREETRLRGAMSSVLEGIQGAASTFGTVGDVEARLKSSLRGGLLLTMLSDSSNACLVLAALLDDWAAAPGAAAAVAAEEQLLQAPSGPRAALRGQLARLEALRAALAEELAEPEGAGRPVWTPESLLGCGALRWFWRARFAGQVRAPVEGLADAISHQYEPLDLEERAELAAWLRPNEQGMVSLADAALLLDAPGVWRGALFAASCAELCPAAVVQAVAAAGGDRHLGMTAADIVEESREKRRCVLLPAWTREQLRGDRVALTLLGALGMEVALDVPGGAGGLLVQFPSSGVPRHLLRAGSALSRAAAELLGPRAAASLPATQVSVPLCVASLVAPARRKKPSEPSSGAFSRACTGARGPCSPTCWSCRRACKGAARRGWPRGWRRRGAGARSSALHAARQGWSAASSGRSSTLEHAVIVAQLRGNAAEEDVSAAGPQLPGLLEEAAAAEEDAALLAEIGWCIRQRVAIRRGLSRIEDALRVEEASVSKSWARIKHGSDELAGRVARAERELAELAAGLAAKREAARAEADAVWEARLELAEGMVLVGAVEAGAAKAAEAALEDELQVLRSRCEDLHRKCSRAKAAGSPRKRR
ncbi:unnamed protein product [Prorocentrum cordatum]|uniref:EF-hand domain-containing protein n=1 Tax=Prorocentrum cordatum TaxID=2364126 RepID=A0ABN9XJY9_9DINO|nr:unnamed protein product [Polarella glacialis]